MSIFNIKLKTKNGNDLKKKETFTVFFRLRYIRGLTKTAIYTYKIMYSKGVHDVHKVLELKDSQSVQSIEELTLRVLLNFCHIIANITKVEQIDPDFIMFISPELDGKTNKSWYYTSEIFNRQDYRKGKYSQRLYGYLLKSDELDLLERFVELNPNTKFMAFDPNLDKVKYAKSIVICSQLKARIEELTNNKKEVDSNNKT